MKKILAVLVVILLLSGIVIANDPLQDPDLFLSLGNFLYRNGYHRSALGAYNTALELDPDNTHVLNNLGHLYKDKNTEAAIHYFQQALELDPNYSNARNNLALMYNSMGLYQQAIEELAILEEQHPQNIQYKYDLAVNYANLYRFETNNTQDLEKSIGYYQEVVGIDSSYEYAAGNLEIIQNIYETVK